MSTVRPFRLLVPAIATAVVLAAGSLGAITLRQEKPVQTRPANAGGATQVLGGLTSVPLHFIENRGQLDRRVDYYVHGANTSFFFTSGGVTLALSAPIRGRTNDLAPGPTPKLHDQTKRWVVRQQFIGANPDAQPSSGGRAPAVVSYFTGSRDNWKTGLPTHSSVVYRDLWPGIDLTYEGPAAD